MIGSDLDRHCAHSQPASLGRFKVCELWTCNTFHSLLCAVTIINDIPAISPIVEATCSEEATEMLSTLAGGWRWRAVAGGCGFAGLGYSFNCMGEARASFRYYPTRNLTRSGQQ